MHHNDLTQLAELIEQGRLRIIIDKTYSIAAVAEALG
jgi:NADPH:quinone reductase-like Zn-dependent oxidoreductase